MSAKTIMVQGTGSYVGKSVIAAALCRIFTQEGLRVAPFKSQNMALNSWVTADGGEMGRAQVFQAKAAKVAPSIDMNPILLKPTSDVGAQVVVQGKAIGNLTAEEYHRRKPELMGLVQAAFDRLSDRSDLIVIEGAGSPAEVNLRANDIVNMPIAHMANAPVLLVGNIDVGGIFAQIVGTLDLLDAVDRDRVKGIIVNKFRGDLSLFEDGVDFLEKRTGLPVLGVIPYFTDIPVEEEDSLAPERARHRRASAQADQLDIAVVFLPHISNFTDFDALEVEPDTLVRFVRHAEELDGTDCIILPGSKSTIADLRRIREAGIADRIVGAARAGVPIFGVCGGYQMLGRVIRDPSCTEADVQEVRGLGLLDVETEFVSEKVTTQSRASIIGGGEFFDGYDGPELEGYEIHMGESAIGDGVRPALEITQRQGESVSVSDGAVSADGRVFGCYLHGLFDNAEFRRHFLNVLRRRKGLLPLDAATEVGEDSIDRLAEHVRQSLNMPILREIVGL
ncbi:MAG: cobyric acid synthase CobQ [Armatimonadetes bacterium CG2_30_59_28]|nr:cobyric acid synthase [Armatimonadota bacterium]OIO89644.1 MAG: cobyric acid synthase CobQ [Armatimonadetes bacterium CG2_30_59_28]PIU60584.1 MAG: cobyric acid synthase CobQ [Armatimonadetes bacterium CG07_land_8_20_14_0_80_59_28]PIX42235.1 MAG: cobyric acid synthase CobQ [Armatimonadetes bacterium CG_4_8_14_3_um_filter_58_9]PIY42365.1 MAG: cobyric acid synthase CobQ [Armatimonadetes bacterium CG_4_10_14_3_um_filter_59_10]PJB74680.1 MAG: cobyric acid synthase CobQ [Armatimonadetes bacterium